MSTVKAQIVEGVTGEPLASATISLINMDADFLGQGVMTDSTGKFALTSSALTGNFLLISYTGLESAIIATDLLNDREYKVVPLYSKELEAVIVTPGKKTGGLGWLLLLGMSIIVIVSKKKRVY